MDEFDAAIFRELHREREFLWGGVDPRLGATSLADRLEVNRTTIWSRLKAWEEEGFLLGQEVVPNPSLFGAGLAAGSLRIDDPRGKEEVFAALRLVDGVLVWIDQVGPWVMLGYAHESPRTLDRCTRLIGEIRGVEEVTECIPFQGPEPTLAPTGRDWRIIAALRRGRGRRLAQVAEEVGINARTLTRRYRRLLESQAVWSFPTFDFSRYRDAAIARFLVFLEPEGDSLALVNACRRGLSGAVWVVSLDQLVPGHDYEQTWVDAFCHLAAPGKAESVQTWLLDQPHVVDVEIYWPKAWHMVPDWFDDRIARRLESAQVHEA